jgi:hypothetical protein
MWAMVLSVSKAERSENLVFLYKEVIKSTVVVLKILLPFILT